MFVSQHPGVANYKGQLPFSLKNSGDQIRLYKWDNSLFLSVEYDDNAPWPVAADGKGKTLELLNPAVNLNLASNWFEGCFGGSPGKAYDPKCITDVSDAETKNSFEVSVWPIPSQDFIRINVFCGDQELRDLSFFMYDFTGNEIIRISSLRENEIIVNRFDFPSGIYVIKVGNDKSFLTKKIIFQ